VALRKNRRPGSITISVRGFQKKPELAGLFTPLRINCTGKNSPEYPGIDFAFVDCRRITGIAHGSFNLPDNIAEICHRLWTSFVVSIQQILYRLNKTSDR
jgi:hypothetical protein